MKVLKKLWNNIISLKSTSLGLYIVGGLVFATVFPAFTVLAVKVSLIALAAYLVFVKSE